MQTPIVPINRAPEGWIIGLLEAGILEINEDGVVKCASQNVKED